MYQLQQLQQDVAKGKKLKYLCFWGHQPSSDGSTTKSCFSQWWGSCFTVEEIGYSSAEQYMMAEKARLFQDEEYRQQILSSTHPKQAKALGRMVRGFDQDMGNRDGS